MSGVEEITHVFWEQSARRTGVPVAGRNHPAAP
jgi:hypothetical protein